MDKTKANNIDAYIAQFPENIQAKLTELRELIKKTVPAAEEVISYAMPAYKIHGRGLIYFGASKEHIGFYPFPSGVEFFKNLADKGDYVNFKGTIQFPYNRPLPHDLIVKIVEFRVKENEEAAALKKARK